jgi:hypothetical protein
LTISTFGRQLCKGCRSCSHMLLRKCFGGVWSLL